VPLNGLLVSSNSLFLLICTPPRFSTAARKTVSTPATAARNPGLLPAGAAFIIARNLFRYTYWVLSKASGPASTLMGCPDNSLHAEFVRVQGDGYLVYYNSRLLMVIYVPKDFEVRFRLWQAQKRTSAAKEE
jgi:hypothetical protein